MRKVCVTLLLFTMTFVYPSGSQAGSRSFSSGGSRPSFSSGSKPTFSNSGRSYSSGIKPSPSSGKSFSSGNKPQSTSPASGKSYSDGSKGYSTGSSIKPTKQSFDTLGGKEQMKVESRNTYQKATSPKTEYKTSNGKTTSIDPKDTKIANLRSQLNHERWVNRESRQVQFYGTYYSRPVVIYHDPYPSFFWWWLLDRSLEERAMWAYHHRTTMDQQRYQALLAKDAQLEAKIRQLEAQNVVRDPTYTPKGMDQDLMYSNEYVDAVYNPTPPGIGWLAKILLLLIIISFSSFFIWFVFIRRS